MGEHLAGELGTELAASPALMGSMACERLPREPAEDTGAILEDIAREAKTIVSLNRIGDADWLRVSAALYNELCDTDRLLAWIRSKFF